MTKGPTSGDDDSGVGDDDPVDPHQHHRGEQLLARSVSWHGVERAFDEIGDERREVNLVEHLVGELLSAAIIGFCCISRWRESSWSSLTLQLAGLRGTGAGVGGHQRWKPSDVPRGRRRPRR